MISVVHEYVQHNVLVLVTPTVTCPPAASTSTPEVVVYPHSSFRSICCQTFNLVSRKLIENDIKKLVSGSG